MNRYKYLVWNGENMISPDYIDRKGTAWWKEDSIPCYSKELLEYTGINDMNDKELFDGQIFVCKIWPFYSDKECKELNYVGVVVWDNYGWYYDLHRVSDRVGGVRIGRCLDDVAHSDTLEVIGHKLSHPELLTVKENKNES